MVQLHVYRCALTFPLYVSRSGLRDYIVRNGLVKRDLPSVSQRNAIIHVISVYVHPLSYSQMWLPLLVLKARNLIGSAFCTGFSRLEVPEQAMGGIPLGLGLVVKINHLNFHVQSKTVMTMFMIGRVLLRVTWVVASQALRMSHY